MDGVMEVKTKTQDFKCWRAFMNNWKIVSVDLRKLKPKITWIYGEPKAGKPPSMQKVHELASVTQGAR